MTSGPSEYDSSDFENIVNHVHQNLCTLDQGDRAVGRDPQWQDLRELVSRMEAYSDTTNISYLAEYMLKDERGLIETDKSGLKVRLTPEGRKQCGQRLKEKS